MTEDNHPNRRTVLKSLSAATAAGVVFSGQSVAANSEEDKVENDSGIPFDLKVKNSSFDDNTLKIDIFNTVVDDEEQVTRKAKPIYSKPYPLNGISKSKGTAKNVIKQNLDLPGDRVYEIRVSTPNGKQSASTMFGVPEGGIPDYMCLFADQSFSGKLRVTVAKE